MDKQVRQAIIARGGQAQIVFLDALLKLRQICCHPTLLAQNKNATESAKFDYLIDLLETLRREHHRVLIFSQFTSMLSLIEAHLIEEDVSYLILTGATKDRQSLVERFQDGEGEVFLISLKAGGTGLTLTGADTVIHYDPWWNPAVENQATDRAYRIGQDKPVMVHKLICQGTVEERIQQMQKRKNTLADNILDGSTQNIALNEETMRKLLE
jgi:SNF2 family DNA or RNA helicase